MKLPEKFIENIKTFMNDEEFIQFYNTYNNLNFRAIRANTLKISTEEFEKIVPFDIKKVPWTRDGYYIGDTTEPGKNQYYYCGLYYIQEPSAMLPAEVLSPLPGERVLDMCAAPGGKTVQLAAAMKNQGVLVTNDISPKRVKALVKNIELCGVKNALVTNEDSKKLAEYFEGYFDKILIDAPCSGEGMFRKDPDAVKSWSQYKNEECASIQSTLLDDADKMLKPGGTIVYSTCTFNQTENELSIIKFLEKHNNYEIVEIEKKYGIDSGIGISSEQKELVKNFARLWPHKVNGEGHFVAKLRKAGTLAKNMSFDIRCNIPEEFDDFCKRNLNVSFEGNFYEKKGDLYLTPDTDIQALKGLNIVKCGLYLGKIKEKRFEPAHSVAVVLKRNDFKRTVDFEYGSDEFNRYLKGETLIIDGEKGYTGVLLNGYSAGWASQVNGILKNMYPKGWRKMN